MTGQSRARTPVAPRVASRIDYYDKTLAYHSTDPSDPSVTERVITIMSGGRVLGYIKCARLAGRVATAPRKFNAADCRLVMRRVILDLEFSLSILGQWGKRRSAIMGSTHA